MLEPVLKRSRGFDYICLNVNDEGKSVELSCLGRHDKVRLPISEPTRKRIEERFGDKIDWENLQNKIRKLQVLQNSNFQRF